MAYQTTRNKHPKSVLEGTQNTILSAVPDARNHGVKDEIYCNNSIANEIISISRSFNIEAQIIGKVEKSDKKELIIESKGIKVEY